MCTKLCRRNWDNVIGGGPQHFASAFLDFSQTHGQLIDN